MVREYTNRILDRVEDGILDPTEILKMCLVYMSEAEVKDMAECEGIFPEEEEDND